MNIKTILVPVDFSTCSLLVSRQAAGLARSLGARVVLLHVAELPADISANLKVEAEDGPHPAIEVLTSDSEARLGAFAAVVREEGAEAEVRVLVGPVVPSILDATSALQADLVVIGTHGRTGMARVMLGSVAEEVARRSHVPVMLVRRETRPECARANCEWCPHDGRSPVERQLAAEAQG